MRHLQNFRLFEQEIEQKCFAPSYEELEKLPAYQELDSYLRNMPLKSRSFGHHGLQDGGIIRWDGPESSYQKGIRTFDTVNSVYTFKLNPCSKTIYYGKEKVNKDFDVPFDTLDDWNKAIRILGEYSIGRHMGVPYSGIRKIRETDPKRILGLLTTGRLNGDPVESGGKFNEWGYKALLYLLGEEGLIEILVKLVKKKITWFKFIPDELDRSVILQRAGYNPEDIKGLTLSAEFGLI